MSINLIDDKWVREIHRQNGDPRNRYTFCGALEYRYNHIAKNWNPETRKKHEREYNNIILPALKEHNNKTIREYTHEDFEQAIENIKERGYIQDGIRHQYSEASIHNFENLIYYVVFQAAVYGLCENVLWGTKFVLKETDENAEIEEKVVLKKSLTVIQEKRLYEEVMSDSKEDGAVVALLLMWALGLRNAEACGLNYGDIRLLEGHQDCYVAWIYKSTKINSNELQSGGKTYNTGRILPIPDKVLSFILQRKAYIEQMLFCQGKNVEINELPICCDGYLDTNSDNYIKRCRADRVTAVAHDVFESAGITSRQVAFLDAELSDGNAASMLKEKEPTAYLLRRNFATQMCILGLSYPEMQYLMGHDVEDAYESRNEFVDSERIYLMHLKLKQRELLNHIERQNNRTEICLNKNELVKVHISAKESADCIKLKACISNPEYSTIRWFSGSMNPSYDRTINIIQSYHSKYQ